jgi:ABC-2 type transport system ATP-binding protein
MEDIMNTILECKSLTKKYSSLTALDNVNLTLERGRIIGLLGPNGSGKTTLIKLINGLLVQNSGELLINGKSPNPETKKVVSYLPEKTYLPDWMRVSDTINFFKDFYQDFDEKRAYDMLTRLQLDPSRRLKSLSKGTKEKVQLILVMSRQADLYCLDEPIGGVDPAARDYILNTIISNYNENATVLISTHLIADIEKILDEVVFIKNGHVTLHESVDDIRSKEGKSIDTLFREVFKC